MPPEQLRRTKDVDARADIWSLGVILQELIVGEAPFMADSLPEIIAMILSEPPLSMRLRRPDVPPELEAVIRRCLEKDPAARFASVAELALALQPFAPERSRVSIERVTRVIAGRQEVSLSPSAEPAVVRVKIHDQPTVATNSSWHTSGILRSARSGKRLLAVSIGGLVAGGAVAAAVVLSRGGPRTDVRAAPLPATTGAATAVATAAPAPSATETATGATATPTASQSPAATTVPALTRSATRPGAPLSRPTAATASAASPTPVATATAPAPTKTGTADFGGRK
jgi:serine/threonine-protein kinase